ncbi:MAG: BamA/TamA family outer membrane protein [bacterium]|nr:BamA/TamA family outer membrane protein [bacterium]
MIQFFRSFLIIVILSLITPIIGYSQYWEFGQNKVQYRDFNWKVIETKEFSIIYYEGGERIAKFAKTILLDAYKLLSQTLSHTPQEPIPVIIYNSHNDFEQTNVTLSLIDEATGGFTEVFKNRVVVPFNGSYEDFRRVLVHELTHAFQFSISRGTGIIPRISLLNIPLWFVEGMAEYLSLGWDAESDMIIRDALYYDKIKPIKQLYLIEGSYLMYKEGQSILQFIADRYGRKKIGELFHKIGLVGGLNKAIESVLGINVEELNRLWMADLKKKYWASCALKDEVPSDARRLTEHKDYFFNTAPSISPDGSEIVFISDRDEYENLYLMSSIDGRIKCKLIGGGKSAGFESLHILYGGTTWDPSGKNIAFVAKSSGKDVLYIMDVCKRKVIKKFSPKLDGIFSPSFSPDGKFVAFRGIKDGMADIYVLNIATGKLEQLTSDEYDDLTPNWSPDGEYIIFSSDRPLNGESWHYGKYTIFKIGTTYELPIQIPQPILENRASYVASPIWIQDKILFVSNQDGVNNLYILDVGSSPQDSANYIMQLTNVIGGIFTPSISNDGKHLAFCSYTDMGWDIYTIKYPLQKGLECSPESSFSRCYTEVKFAESCGEDTAKIEAKKLGLRFTPDWGGGSVSYVYGGGIFGNLRLAVSDLLGNHQFYIETNSPGNLTANYYISYLYLPRRLDFGIATFKQEYYWLIGDTLLGDLLLYEKLYGGGVLFEYPIDKFRRVDLELNGYVDEMGLYPYHELDTVLFSEKLYISGPVLSYVLDNSIWGPMGPQNGERGKITVSATLPVVSPTWLYNYYKFDLRKYIRITNRYSFAIRAINAGIWGKDKERVYLAIGGADDLRGYKIGEFKGRNVSVLNFELRYPFIDKLMIAFPIPISIGGIRGALFCDFGYATDELKRFKPFEQGVLKDLKFGFGTGLRIRFPFFIIRFDIAKNTNLLNLSKETYMYLSLGPEF